MLCTLYLPEGLQRITYDDAVKRLKEMGANTIQRWSDKDGQYEDFLKDEVMIGQIHTKGYPLTQSGFVYKQKYGKTSNSTWERGKFNILVP